MKKRAKVIMLPTRQHNKSGMIVVREHDNKLCTHTDKVEFHGQNHHLYLTTDDEIKEGDWYLHCDIHIKLCTKTAKGNGTTIADGVTSSIKDIPDEMFYDVIDCKKIIATTNPELNLPQPSKEFIEEYCRKGGIDEVNVEYEEIPCEKPECKSTCSSKCVYPDIKLKVTSNNEIIIHPTKDAWTKEEVIQLFSEYQYDKAQQIIKKESPLIPIDWIKERLK